MGWQKGATWGYKPQKQTKQKPKPKILQTNSLVHTRAQSVPGTSKPSPELRLTPLPSGAQGVPGKSWEMGVGLGARLALGAGSGFELWARPYSFALGFPDSITIEHKTFN